MCAPALRARVEPSLNVAAGLPLTCPACGREFYAPSAEDLAFNSGGACPTCGGTGVMREVDEASLVPDESKTINEGAGASLGHAYVGSDEAGGRRDGRTHRRAV